MTTRMSLCAILLLNILFFVSLQVFRNLKTNASHPSQNCLDGGVKKHQLESDVQKRGTDVI